VKVLDILLEANSNIAVIGDSIAVGIKGAGGAGNGTAVGGSNTTKVLGFVKDFVNSGAAKGATVILSSGAANSSKVVTNDGKVIQQENFGPVATQIKLLKNAGASVALVGVASKQTPPQKPTQYTNGKTWTVDYTGVNDQLESIASANGAKFLGPLEQFDSTISQHDGIHPYNGYGKLFQAGSAIGKDSAAAKPTAKPNAQATTNTSASDETNGKPNPDVLKAQQILISHGYLPNGKADGLLDQATKDALDDYFHDLEDNGEEDGEGDSSAPVGTTGNKKPTDTSRKQNRLTSGGGTGSAKTAFDYFTSQGWSKAQAAGIVGNLQAESGPNLNTSVVGDGGQAYGIAQWHPDRQARFKKAIGRNIKGSSLEDQLAFVQWELTHTETKAAGMLRGAKTPAQAASIMDQYYERSSGAHRNKRIAFANNLAGTATA
jgi:hypothetical protein